MRAPRASRPAAAGTPPSPRPRRRSRARRPAHAGRLRGPAPGARTRRRARAPGPGRRRPGRRASGGSSPERLVEEAEHAPLVLRRALLDGAHVRGLGDLPQRRVGAGHAGVVTVERLTDAAVRGCDEQHRGVDLGRQIQKAGRRRGAGEHGDRCALDARDDRAEHLILDRVVAVALLAVAATAGAVRDDRRELGGAGGLLEHHLPAAREPDAADAGGLNVAAALEEPDRRGDVLGAAPAPRVGPALAAALAAAIEEQDAVAVPRPEARALLRAVAAGERDDGGAVA